jgi:cytochrome b involved in lipid metabolism
MPFENQSTNESMASPQQKGNRLTIILIILIILSGSYLVYSFYNQNGSDNTNTEPLEEVNADINSNQAIDTVSSSTPQDIESIDTPIDDSNNQTYTLSQVAENNNKSSCWTIIDNNVYDITSYVPRHPGGESEILQVCGQDGTALFNKPSEHKSNGARNILETFKIGNISP